jgi:hypothetical protein
MNTQKRVEHKGLIVAATVMVAMSGRSPHSYKRKLKIGLAAQMDRNSTSENVLSPSGEKAYQLPTYPKSQSTA